jgi:hypothetical protein
MAGRPFVLHRGGEGRRVVVTGGDAAYFPMICELLASIRRFRGPDRLGVVVLDCGLEPGQAEHLRSEYAADVTVPDWHYDLPARRVRGREHLKALIVRPFLPQYCPDADVICWVDADAWVQDIAALDMMFDAAAGGSLAIVSQNSRYGERAVSLRWFAFGLAEVRSILYKNARKAGVRERDARKMADKGTMNCGVFALARNAPHWEAWRKRQAQVIRRARLFSSDQFTLGMVIYVDGLPVTLMPETCNYFGPLWKCDDAGHALLEFYPPYNAVGIVHMAGLEAMRQDPAAAIDIAQLAGGTISRSLRYPAWAVEQTPAAAKTASR